MTYHEALRKGYKLGDQRWHRGYISRRINVDDQEVQEAGGYRRGELYVELPTWRSSSYYIRQYLIPPTHC